MREFETGERVVVAEGKTQAPLYQCGLHIGRMTPTEVAIVDTNMLDAYGRLRVYVNDTVYWVNPNDVRPFAPETEDAVNHPAHYTFAKEKLGGVEVIDILEAFFPDEPLLWQVGKYMLRAGHKGSLLEDLEKARWYLDRRIEQEKA